MQASEQENHTLAGRSLWWRDVRYSFIYLAIPCLLTGLILCPATFYRPIAILFGDKVQVQLVSLEVSQNLRSRQSFYATVMATNTHDGALLSLALARNLHQEYNDEPAAERAIYAYILPQWPALSVLEDDGGLVVAFYRLMLAIYLGLNALVMIVAYFRYCRSK